MPNELVELLEFLGSGSLWIYFVLMIFTFYIIIALLTWSFRKPLMFLGIPSIIGGIILIIIRLLIGIIPGNSLISSLLPSLLQPLFTIGIICVVMGILMIISNILLKKKFWKKDKKQKSNNQEEVNIELSQENVEEKSETEDVLKEQVEE